MSEKKLKIVDGQMYTYEIFKLVDPYSDILKTKMEPFDFKNPPTNPKDLAVSLIETMVANRGVGLSANQVGLPYRVFVMGAEKVGFACFNPEVLEYSGEDKFEEGCLSFPGLYLPISRPSEIKVRYTDFNGVTKEEKFSGLTARIFLHELDHMDGIVYTSKVSPIIVEKKKRKIKSNLKKLEAQRKEFQRLEKEKKRVGL